MQNLSGKANWLKEETTTKTKMVVAKKKKVTIKLTTDIKTLERINSSIDKKYKITPDKNLLDAMISLDMAIMSLQNVN